MLGTPMGIGRLWWTGSWCTGVSWREMRRGSIISSRLVVEFEAVVVSEGEVRGGSMTSSVGVTIWSSMTRLTRFRRERELTWRKEDFLTAERDYDFLLVSGDIAASLSL